MLVVDVVHGVSDGGGRWCGGDETCLL